MPQIDDALFPLRSLLRLKGANRRSGSAWSRAPFQPYPRRRKRYDDSLLAQCRSPAVYLAVAEVIRRSGSVGVRNGLEDALSLCDSTVDCGPGSR